MKRISTLLLALAASLLLLMVAAYASGEPTEEPLTEENTEILTEEETADVPDEELPADASMIGESLPEDQPVADGSSESTATGWVKDSKGNWYYYNTDGTVKNGWVSDYGYWYYMDPAQSGKMATNTTLTIDGVSYRFYPSGIMVTGWYKDTDGSWYYYGDNGVRKVGWISYGTTWYYMNPGQNGKMAVNTTLNINGVKYRFKPNGALVTGWYQASDGSWYYSTSAGVVKTGWVYIGSTWFYFNPVQDGRMVSGITMTIGGYRYRFKSSGAMITGWYKDTDGSWYYASSNGVMKSDWVYSYGNWYYVWDGKMVTDTVISVNGTKYRFDSTGIMVTGWYKDASGSWYYSDSNGVVKTGWIYLDYWYYLDPAQNGKMATGVTKIGDHTYWLNAHGAMVTASWKYYDSAWHYFTRYGNMATYWMYIPESGGNFYFYSDGRMAANTTIGGIPIVASGVANYYTSDMTARVQGYSSPTDYMLIVDRSTCKFYIYKGSTFNWTLYDWSYCACGASSTPTPEGTYYLSSGGYYFDSGSSRCFYYRDIYGTIAFHSVLYYQNGYSPYTATVMSSVVGARVSHGCVRLPLAQDLWVYNNAPVGTTVVIF